MKRILKRSICYLTILVCLATFAVPATANGSPVKIFLNYLPELSNYGPTDASGVALVSIGEAWVDLTIDGLPQLENVRYQAWLIIADTEEMVSLGTFTPNADGQVTYHAELDELPITDYRFFVISVERDPDPDPAADERRTIAGVFPNAELQIVSGTPTPTIEPGVTPTPGAPATLPVTGKMVSGFRLLALGLGGGILLVGLGVGLKRRTRSRH